MKTNKKTITKIVNIDGLDITINLDSYFDNEGEHCGEIKVTANTKTMLINRSCLDVCDSYDHELQALKEI